MLIACNNVFCQNVIASNWKLSVSENHRFLQYEDGTPFFWLGNTMWLLPQKLDREEVSSCFQTCEQLGYNVVLVQVLNDVPSVNVYGHYSHPDTEQEKWDLDRWDDASADGYWNHLDYIVHEAEKHNIYVAMTCIWGGLVKKGLMNEDEARQYGTFLAKRYGDNPNIIWVIGGDIQGNVKREVWNALATTIKSLDHQHLMTFHPRGRHTSATWWADAAWLDFHMYQSGHRAYGQRLNDITYPIPDDTEEDCWMYVDSTWTHKPLKPVIDGEPSYEDIPKGLHFPDGPRWKAHDVRRYAYWDVFAGAFGHTYGHNAIMQMHKPGTKIAYSNTCKPWHEALSDSGCTQMQYLKSLILSFPFYERIPDQTIIYKNNGAKYQRLIACRGNDYLMVYNYSTPEMYIDLTKISGKRKSVWWMDAETGKMTYLGCFKNNKMRFKTPHTDNSTFGDGVLIAFDQNNYPNKF